MEFILPKIYEEILERSFEEEALILRDDQLMSILLIIQENDRIQLEKIRGNEKNLYSLIDNGYVRNESNSFLLTQKGVNFLKLLGISSNFLGSPFSKDIDQELKSIYNYHEILKLSKIQIFRHLSIKDQESNEFLRFDPDNSSLECTFFLNCFSNINDFLIKLKSIISNNTKVILYYQNSSQRRNYLIKPHKFLSRPFFSLIDLIKTRLKHRYINKRNLKYLLFYNTKIPRAEVLGRIFYSGFKVIEELCSEEYNRIIVKPNSKAVVPVSNEIKYSSLMKVPRIGKNEKIIYLYKYHTMYPYAEYIQDYIYQINNLTTKGVLENDFRITRRGQILRKFWLDEFPMLINFFNGDLKFFGVRPLSKLYLDLYPNDLRQLRSQFKPGLIPPFYADLPSDLEGIFTSERKYLESYIRRPWITDIRYYFKSLKNILFHLD